MILKTCIEKLLRKENLDTVTIQKVIEEILDANANPLQVSAFLVLLRAKQESVEEISAIVNLLRSKMLTVTTDCPTLDIVGTGGDGYHTVNISTGSAILAASCGIKIAKHGNRAFSSTTGSADVLEALGINIELTPKQVARCIDEVGIAFCYSPNFHPTTHALRTLRKQLSIPTTFNILGPLLNPANVSYTLLGVLNESLLPMMADVLIKTGTKRSVVFHGNGLDEISCVGPTKLIEINGNKKTDFILDPADFGLSTCTIECLQGGNANTNAELLLTAFRGNHGPITDTLILNAAVALYIYGMHSSVSDGIKHARENLNNGSALALMSKWKEFSYDQ